MKKTLLFLCCLVLTKTMHAQVLQLDSTQINITIAIDSNKLVAPWALQWGYDNRLWMTDAKSIKVWNPTTGTLKQIFRFPKGYGMGLAVPKTIPLTPPVYIYAVFDTAVYYAAGSYCKLYRFVYDPILDTLTNATVLLGYSHPGEHSGGRVIFATDGKILVTTPEYTYTNDTLGAVNGRVLRLNPDGTKPSGNYRADYTYTIGHRNSQGMVLLPDGKVICTEHSGPNIHDEINLISVGGNYGWPAMEGYNSCTNIVPDSCASSYFTSHHRSPIYMGSLTPAGLGYYNHPAIPEWKNCLIVGTLYQPDSCLAVLKMNNNHDSILSRRNYLKKTGNGINSFERTRDVCVAPDGSIYCIIKDRSHTLTVDSITNIGCKIVRLKNNAYIAPNAVSEVNFERIKIYPNPANQYISIQIDKKFLPLPYKISDLLGRTVINGVLSSEQSFIQTDKLPIGFYELMGYGENAVFAKILIAR